MNAISEYVITALVVALIAGVGEKIAHTNMKKYINFVASMVLLIFLISPIKTLGEELFRFTDQSLKDETHEQPHSNSYETILRLAKNKAEEEVREHIYQKFELKEKFSISLTMKMEENGSILLTHISLNLSSNNVQLADEIKTYLEKTFYTETSVFLTEEVL